MDEKQAQDTEQQQEVDTSPKQADSGEKMYPDAYVKARIDKQNARHAEAMAAKDDKLAELEEQLSEANKRADQLEHEKQYAEWLKEASEQSGVDASLLRGSTKEELLEHAQQLANALNAHRFEPTPNGGAHHEPTPPTKEEIFAIKDRNERQAAIAANINLFKRGN